MSEFQVGDVVRVSRYDESYLLDTKCRSREVPKNFEGQVGEVVHVIAENDLENLAVKFRNLYPDKAVSKILLWHTEVELVHRPAAKEQLPLIEVQL